MSDSGGLEFTGERVIPGLVEPDLLNEHLSRYRLAARCAEGGSVLDAGCGSGYGAAEFGRASRVVGVDVSAEAIDYASRHFSRPGVHFLRAGCEALPFADGSFDLVTAFEVIEHLEHQEEMLAEARRVLRPAGILLVSTPNSAYYTESRGESGRNPYHVHEFDYAEFRAALRSAFAYVDLWTQNHAEGIAFLPLSPSPGDFDAPADTAPEYAHFFLAACSQSPMPAPRAFAWSPRSGNILRERERHVALLKEEVAQKNAWLGQTVDDLSKLQADHEKLLAEMDQHHRAAAAAVSRLEAELASTHAAYQERGRQLEEELASVHAGYQERVRQLESEAAARLDWARDLERQLAGWRDLAASLERDLARTSTALEGATTQLELAAASKWVRLGRVFHLGPAIGRDDGQPE